MRTFGELPDAVIAWISRSSDSRRMAFVSLSMTTTRLFSEASRLAILYPTSPAPTIMIFKYYLLSQLEKFGLNLLNQGMGVNHLRWPAAILNMKQSDFYNKEF
jgi:hypothetical protein